MLGTADYSLKMPISQALTTALVGIITVLLILSLIAVCIMILSKVIRTIESAAHKNGEKDKAAPAAESITASGATLPDTKSIGSLELIGTDEATAAIIMAIVSDKSGIPLNRLEFKSIRLLEE